MALSITPFWELVLRKTNAGASRIALGITGGVLPDNPSDSDFLVGDGANWVKENAATARTSLGLGDIALEVAPLAVARGGTAGITAAAARTNLGLGTAAVESVDSINPTATGSTTARTLANRFSDIFNILDYGAVDGTDSTTEIQAAIDAAEANLGGIVFFPPGFFSVSAVLTITQGIMLVGSGIGVESGAGNHGGTVIRSTVTAGDIFAVTYDGSVQFRDFTIDAPAVTKASGTAGIRISGTGGTGTLSRRSRIQNVRIHNMYDAIILDASADEVIESCHIQDFLNIGIYLQQINNVDSGPHFISNNVLWDLGVGTSQAGIRYDQGGDIRIVGNKFLGSNYGIRIVRTVAGETGTIQIIGNSIEEQLINGIRLERVDAASPTLGNIIINSNQFSIITATPQSTIAIVAGSAQWVRRVTIADNVINNNHTASFAVFSIQDGGGVTITGNVINNGSQTGPTGMDVGGKATDVLLDNNMVVNSPSGDYNAPAVRAMQPGAIFALTTGNETILSGLTRFLNASDASPSEVLFYLPFKAKILHLFTQASASPGAGETFIYTVRVNAADTALTVTRDSGGTDGDDVTNVVNVPSPDGPNTAARVSLKVVTSAGAVAATHRATFRVVRDD